MYAQVAVGLVLVDILPTSLLAHDVRTTLYSRWNDIKRLKRRRNNAVLTSCVSLVSIAHFKVLEVLNMLALL